MDQGRRVQRVLEADPKAFAGLRDYTMRAVWLNEAEHRGRLAPDVDDAGFGADNRGGGGT